MSKIKLKISSITPFSDIDYPGHKALIVSLQGNIWDCSYASKPIQKLFKKESHYSWDDVLIQILKHRSEIDSVVFNGGEPTIQDDLPQAIKQVKEMGLLVGLHTAGIFPDKLNNCLGDVDWICFDFKAPLNKKYDYIKKSKTKQIQPLTSFKQILASGKPYDVRTDFHCSQIKLKDSEHLSKKLRTLNNDPNSSFKKADSLTKAIFGMYQ